jgi:hypothetical protein
MGSSPRGRGHRRSILFQPVHDESLEGDLADAALQRTDIGVGVNSAGSDRGRCYHTQHGGNLDYVLHYIYR